MAFQEVSTRKAPPDFVRPTNLRRPSFLVASKSYRHVRKLLTSFNRPKDLHIDYYDSLIARSDDCSDD
jgi:hypothetical protein